MNNPFSLLMKKVFKKAPTIPAEIVKEIEGLSDKDKDLLQTIGFTSRVLGETIREATLINFERQKLYMEIDRSLLHWCMGCLRGNTKIRLCSGENVSIKDVSDNSDKYIGKCVWSINPVTLQLEPDKILLARKTNEYAKLVRVYLDNGEFVDTTLNHKFLTRGGVYKEAQYLQSDDSLMPFCSKLCGKIPLKEYELIYNPKTKRFHFGHRLAVEERWKDYPKRRGFVVHHRNFNPQDNDPDNLEIQEIEKHSQFHCRIAAKQHKENCQCCFCKARRRENPNGWQKGSIPWNKGLTKETDERVAKGAKAQEDKIVPQEQRDKISAKLINYPQSEETKRKRSKSMKGKTLSDEHKAKIIKTMTGVRHTYERRTNQSIGQQRRFAKERREKSLFVEALLNHKVVKVELLKEREDVYDITTERNHNFSLSCGIFVHNSAAELYADFCTTYSPMHNATVWITSEQRKYETELTNLLNTIQIEEKIFDWAYTTGAYGDHFVKIDAIPGVGVVGIDDDEHPINISRVDNKVLVGFFKTPQGYASDTRELIAPWEYVHFRILGAKRKRPLYDDPSFSEYRTIHLLSPETRRLTSKYGTSLLTNALSTYKRLRMAEDCLLFARISRGIERNIFKIKVDGSNMEAAAEIINSYKRLLKRSEAFDTRSNTPLYDTKFNPMTPLEDIFIPVWDNVDNLTVDTLGGKVDIKWIVDIEELRNQLACALRVPLQLLGGFVEEATGAFGSEAIEKLDIRFARSARRLQRSQIDGITRICQIHLAYKGMDPDTTLFKVNMPETSTAEEESLKASLDTGVDIVDRMMKTLEDAGIEVDKIGLINFLNQKILKLGDIDFSRFIKGEKTPEAIETMECVLSEAKLYLTYGKQKRPTMMNSDLAALLPERKATFSTAENWTNDEWEGKYKGCKIKIETEDIKKE